MTDDVFVPEPRENRLPIHPPCGHRLLSLGCRAHHRGQGEPEPHLPTVTVMGHSLPAETVQGMLADGTLELVPGSEDLQFRLTAKGKRRAEGLLGLPAGTLDNTEDYSGPQSG